MSDLISHETLSGWGGVIDLAINNANMDGLPFAAIILSQSGQMIGKGVNQVTVNMDCAAHAEIQAIRNASLNKMIFL